MTQILASSRTSRLIKPRPHPYPWTVCGREWAWFWEAMGRGGVALLLNGGVHDYFGGGVYPLEGGASWVDTRYGPALSFDADGEEVNLGDRFNMGGSATGSWGALIIPAVTTNGKPWGSWNDPGSNQWLLQTSTSITWGVKTEPAGTVTAAGGSITTGEPTYVAGTFEQGVALTGYQAGVQVAQNTGDADLGAAVHNTADTPFNVKLGSGGGSGETETQYNGEVVLAWATDSLFTARRIQQLYIDPFGPWRPERRSIVTVPTAPAGPDQTGSISEGADLGDTFDAVIARLGAISEGASLGDTFLGETEITGTLSEGTSLGETFDALVARLASISEGADMGMSLGTAVATDFPDMGALFGETMLGTRAIGDNISEGTTLGDTFAGSTDIVGQILEGGEFGDTWAASVALLASWSEGADFGDTYATVRARLASMSQGADMGESFLGTRATGQAVSEGGVFGATFEGDLLTEIFADPSNVLGPLNRARILGSLGRARILGRN